MAIRLSGVLLLALGALGIGRLVTLVHAGPLHDTSPIEMGLAALGFLALSMGSALVSLGAHIFDTVEISARWTNRSGNRERG